MPTNPTLTPVERADLRLMATSISEQHTGTRRPTHCDVCSLRVPCDSRDLADQTIRALDMTEELLRVLRAVALSPWVGRGDGRIEVHATSADWDWLRSIIVRYGEAPDA